MALNFVVSRVPNLNMIGREAIKLLGISIDNLFNQQTTTTCKVVDQETKAWQKSTAIWAV